MASTYLAAKEIYFKMRNIPILGSLLVRISPFAQKIIRRMDARQTQNSEIFKEVEMLSQNVLSIRSSVKGALQQNQAEIHDFRTQVDGYRAQIDDYRNRLEFIRLEILEQCGPAARGKRGESAKSEIKILNREKYDAALAANKVLVNVGCGHKPLSGYLNVDKRGLPGVDIVADAVELPFGRGTVSEIYAAHLVEHFTVLSLKNEVFPYWFDLLVSGGILKIIVPDMPSMITAYFQGTMPFSDLREVTFGAQDYDDDFHYAMFSPQSAQSMLMASGFKYAEIVSENRVNGKCREMEIWARKF
ncbi:MAG: hypothetical protein DELT_01894 [Desulfovibrio sp.]